MNKNTKHSSFILLFLILIFVFIRSINFTEHLNFSYDQGWGSTRVLEIWRNKEITLVGPGSSLIAEHKEILQGSIIYYFNLIFLLIGAFDPIKSSYVFMLISSIMIIPLYLGVKNLINKNGAIIVSVIYALSPLFIDYTRFFFGPNFQLSLFPILVYFMGLEKIKKGSLWLFLVFFSAGFLLQFHYAFILIIIGLLIYYIIKAKNKLQSTLISFFGLSIGFLPMILFELKNSFYNSKILMLYLITPHSNIDFLHPHRYLSITLLLIILIAYWFRKSINIKHYVVTFFLLLTLSLYIYLPLPTHGFGMKPHWNYLMEKKTYEIIKKQNLKDFNVVNHIYDNLSVVIKYQMKKDGYVINFDDYYHNKYLYVISSTPDVFKDPAYELNTFKPNKLVKVWKLNNYYNLYLFERLK